MNWVEKKHERTKNRADQTPPLLESVKAAIRGAVDSFNQLYRESGEQIVISTVKDTMTLSMNLPLMRHEYAKQATATISFDERRGKVTAVFKNSNVPEESLVVDIDGSGIVFLKRGDGSALQDPDEASRVLLESFFLELENV